jgi:hypothetical protein
MNKMGSNKIKETFSGIRKFLGRTMSSFRQKLTKKASGLFKGFKSVPYFYGLKSVFAVIAFVVVSKIMFSDTRSTESGDVDWVTLWQIIGLLAFIALGIYLIVRFARVTGSSTTPSAKIETSESKTVVVSQSTSAKPTPTVWSSLTSFFGFLVGAALVMYVIMLTYGYGVKTFRGITGDDCKKSSTIKVSTWESKTLKFDSEENAEFVLIAPPGYRIKSDAFPANGVIVTNDGSRYRVGPDYGYKIPDLNSNIHWKCISMGNPFEVTVYTAKKIE